MKEVLITVNGRQEIPNSEPCDIEIITKGNINEKNGKIYLTYDESKTLKENNVSTLIKIDGENSVVLKRSGDIESRMLIEPGKRNICFYNKKEGSIALGITGFKIENSLKLNGGKLHFQYAIDTDNSLVSKNSVSISVREV